MKKQITLLFLLMIHCSAWSQKAIPTDGPCTDEMLQKMKGKWIKSFDINPDASKEMYARLDAVHKMVFNIYPQPTAVDAVWHRANGVSYFGAKRKFNNPENRSDFDYSNLPHFSKFSYTCLFMAYFCGNGNTMWPGTANETGTMITITANEIDKYAGNGDDEWTLNGLPVRMLTPAYKTIKEGYEIHYPEPGSNIRYILIYRKGVLPYIPVTKKQYLDKCLIYTSQLYDSMISGVKQMPVRSPEEQEKEKNSTIAQYQKNFGTDPVKLKSAVDYYLSGYQTDQQRRDEQLEKINKVKEAELKLFRFEQEKSSKEGLLDSAAIVLGMYLSNPVFTTDPEKVRMLVTENPDYIRKDLPKYVPQVFVVWWSWEDWAPQKEIGKIIEENFPFDKLQAMIDK